MRLWLQVRGRNEAGAEALQLLRGEHGHDGFVETELRAQQRADLLFTEGSSTWRGGFRGGSSDGTFAEAGRGSESSSCASELCLLGFLELSSASLR